MTIFQFSHYKDFLKSYISNLPKNGRGEINRIAEYLRVHPTLISQVLNGPKDFTAEQGFKLGSYMGLSSLEADFWILLLQRERAGTVEFKKYYSTKIEEMKMVSLRIANRLEKHRRLTDFERSVFYSSWIYSAVHLFTSIGKGQSLGEISKRFSLSRDMTSKIIQFLKETGVCGEKNGLNYMREKHTHLEFGSPFLHKHHTNWRLKAIQNSESLSEEEMMFSAPFSISKEDFLKIREELIRVINSVTKKIKDSSPEEIACLNLDLFWIKN